MKKFLLAVLFLAVLLNADTVQDGKRTLEIYSESFYRIENWTLCDTAGIIMEISGIDGLMINVDSVCIHTPYKPRIKKTKKGYEIRLKK